MFCYRRESFVTDMDVLLPTWTFCLPTGTGGDGVLREKGGGGSGVRAAVGYVGLTPRRPFTGRNATNLGSVSCLRGSLSRMWLVVVAVAVVYVGGCCIVVLVSWLVIFVVGGVGGDVVPS